MNHFEFLDEFFIPKTRVIGLSVGEDFVILACVVFTQCQRVTDGQTDGQTDKQTDIPIVPSTGLAATLTPCKKGAAAPCSETAGAKKLKKARRRVFWHTTMPVNLV